MSHDKWFSADVFGRPWLNYIKVYRIRDTSFSMAPHGTEAKLEAIIVTAVELGLSAAAAQNLRGYG